MVKQGNIHSDFVVMSPDKNATIEPGDAGLYQRLDENYASFAGHDLIACHEFQEDWPSWEIHPRGDELVVLLAGEARFVLQIGDVLAEIQLAESGSYVIVPKNAWHTAKIDKSAKMLFITPGEGTQNRDI